MTRLQTICLLSYLMLQASCTTKTIGIGKLYRVPTTPECVGMVEGYGLYDYRACDKESIGQAWVQEKRTREKYEKQIVILNE